ncbi:D-alanyl-D-alanine endopeptidase [Burkholderia sp. Bp9002]|nr:D-alanyl-D-alanine endopeptidase [Burkholderia sp. Bp9002]
MSGTHARAPRARTFLLIIASILLCAFMSNASAHRVEPRPAQRHATAAKLKKPAAHARRAKHRRPRVRHHAAKPHIAPGQQPHRTKRVSPARHRAAPGPRLLASCGYSPRAVNALHSRAVYVLDVRTGKPLLARNARTVRPIASISKLMTAVVARNANRPLDGMLRVTAHDRDAIKFTHSRLRVGSTLSRRDMHRIALMSSENRAAAALSRDYPGGRPAFVAAMNREARRLGMRRTRFHEATGLSPRNVSTAEELARLVDAAARDPLIRRFSTARSGTVQPGSGTLRYVNSDPLVRYGQWPIQLQKTGFINEAGHGVVMRTHVHGRPETIVLLGAPTRAGVTRDAQTIHRWLACSLM